MRPFLKFLLYTFAGNRSSSQLSLRYSRLALLLGDLVLPSTCLELDLGDGMTDPEVSS